FSSERADWSSDLEHAGLCIGWRFGACACWGCWGALHRGGWGWSWVCRAWRAGGGALFWGGGWGGGGGVVPHRGVVARVRGAGCTAAGTWRAGAGMGFWSLWGARTIRSRFAASALSPGRSRQRCCGMKACRRLLWLRAWIGRGASSLLAMLFWRRVRLRMRRGLGGMVGGALPTTWGRLRSLVLVVFPCRRTGSLPAVRCLRRRFVLGSCVWRAVRGRSCCARCLPRYWVWSVLGSTTTFSRSGATASYRSSW